MSPSCSLRSPLGWFCQHLHSGLSDHFHLSGNLQFLLLGLRSENISPRLLLRVPKSSNDRHYVVLDSYPNFLFDLRVEVNLANYPQDYSTGFGAILSGGPRITLPSGSIHDNESCERQGSRKRPNLTFAILQSQMKYFSSV